MPSRLTPYALALALILGALPVPMARAALAPADSTTAPAAETPPDTTAAPAEAKPEAKPEVKETPKQKSESAKEAKKAKDAAKKAAKKKGSTVKSTENAAAGTMPVKPATPPQHVTVQHILIGFSGSVPGKDIARSKEEAKTLAYELLERARKGESFDELVAKFTDDSPPGIYKMCATGLQPGPGEFSRDGMVAAFGNVGFSISPGNIGIADYDPQASPFGYHIIKRLK